jgi:hypothetical protein
MITRLHVSYISSTGTWGSCQVIASNYSPETIYEEFEKMNKKIDLISEKMDLFLSQMKDANTPIKPI